MSSKKIEDESDNIVIDRISYYRILRSALAHQMNNRGGICGQAFTNYKCAVCLKIESHSNTCTPVICPSCSKTATEEIKRLWEGGFFNLSEND